MVTKPKNPRKPTKAEIDHRYKPGARHAGRCSTMVQHDAQMKTLLIAMMALAVGQGCTTTYETPEQVSDATATSHDRYTGRTTVKGPRVTYGEYGRSYCYLIAIQDQDGITYGLSIRSINDGWKFLDRARDRDGRELDTLEMDRAVVRGATVKEYLVVLTPRDYLESIPPDNLDVKLFGDRGSEVVRLGPEYIRGFLDRVDQVLGPENDQTEDHP